MDLRADQLIKEKYEYYILREEKIRRGVIDIFIDMRLVVTTTGTKTYMSEIIELYRRQFENKFHISDRLRRKDAFELFKNSKLSKYLREDKRGYYILDMRFLPPKEKKHSTEKFVFLSDLIDDGKHKDPEYIYLIKEREFIKTKEDIYKIGKTRQSPNNRLTGYPKSSEVILFLEVPDCDIIEKTLIEIFKDVFIQRKDIGTEYFEGDKNKMIEIIFENIACVAD